MRDLLARTGLPAALICTSVCIGSMSVLAHPHAWIENRSDVVFNDDGQIIALNVAWVFDEMYSEAAVEGLDTNKDGFYSSGELEPLAKANIEALEEFSYFVYAHANGKKVEYGKITEYGQIHSDGILKMHFTVPLAKPVDPQKLKFTYKIYDPSFYIAIDYAKKDPIAAIGNKPKECELELGKIEADEKTEETRNELAKKDKDWQPDTEQDFGALFAQPVRVICKQKTTLLSR